jgi:hypothetical protein
MEGPASDKPTRLESPQSREAQTEAIDSTTNPYGPKVLDQGTRPQGGATMRIAHTFQDGAPAPMTMVPNLSPQPPIVDRNAETNAAPPDSVAMPQHNTLLMAPSPQPAPMPAPSPEHQVSTFGAQTTDAPSRGRAGAIVFVAIGFCAVLAIGIGVVFAVRHADKKPVAAPPPPVAATIDTMPIATPTVSITPLPAVVSVIPVVSTAAPSITSAPPLVKSSRPQPTASVKKDALHVGSGLD